MRAPAPTPYGDAGPDPPDAAEVRVNIRMITVGNVHAEGGDAAKVAAMHGWLVDNPDSDLPALDVRAKDNGTFRIHDGRHRFLAYVLAGRDTIPVDIGVPD